MSSPSGGAAESSWARHRPRVAADRPPVRAAHGLRGATVWSYVLGVVRLKSLWVALVAVVLVVLVACGEREERHAEISQHLFDRNGDPSLIGGADPYGDGHGSVLGWRACPAKGDCGPVVAETGDEFEPGQTSLGTRFELVVDYRGHESRALSRTWQGRLRAVTPPALEGTVAVGSKVRVRPARWRGGWRERDASRAQRIEACKTRHLVECEVLAAPNDISGTDASAVISRYYAGWYVQALDAYYAQDTLFTLPGYSDVSGVPPLMRSGNVAASGAVRVPGRPVEVPQVTLRDRVGFRNGRAVVGRVRCARCEVELSPPPRNGNHGRSCTCAVPRRCGSSAVAAAALKCASCSTAVCSRAALCRDHVEARVRTPTGVCPPRYRIPVDSRRQFDVRRKTNWCLRASSRNDVGRVTLDAMRHRTQWGRSAAVLMVVVAGCYRCGAWRARSVREAGAVRPGGAVRVAYLSAQLANPRRRRACAQPASFPGRGQRWVLQRSDTHAGATFRSHRRS